MVKKDSFLAIGPLFLVLLIDGMGLSLLFPILSNIIIDPASHFLQMKLGAGGREFLYGVIVSIFMLCWFFGAAILGDLSDSIGRKKALLICLLGSFVGYFLSAMGIIAHSITLLVIGRVIAGFTAGSQPIAQAAIIDISSNEHKARNIGMILLAISLGFVIGPILGGVLSSSNLVSWFNFATPLYFASILSFLNAILLQLFFKETFSKTEKIKLRLTHAFNVFISAFKHPNIRHLSLILLIMIIGWSNFFSFFAVYLIQHFGLTFTGISVFMALLAIGFSIGCGFFVDLLTRRYSFNKIVANSFILAAAAVLLTLFTSNLYITGLLTILIGTSIAVGYSVILTLFSNQVGPNEQGWVMGVTGSIMALCFGLTTLITGAIAIYSSNIPMILAVIGLLISGVLMALDKSVTVQTEAAS